MSAKGAVGFGTIATIVACACLWGTSGLSDETITVEADAGYLPSYSKDAANFAVFSQFNKTTHNALVDYYSDSTEVACTTILR